MTRKAPSKGWRCPRCGRTFKQRTNEHSCDVLDLESHFARGNPELVMAFQAIEAALLAVGDFEIVPVKTMIVFRKTSNFGGVTFKRGALDVGFFLGRRVFHPRITKVEEISPKKIAHHVRVTSVTDVDAELIDWLQQAYML